MIQTVKKWGVRVEFAGKEDDLYFWLSDNHWQNVISQLAAMDFAGTVARVSITNDESMPKSPRVQPTEAQR